MSNYPSRKEPFVSDDAAGDVDRQLMEETSSALTAENWREYSPVTARRSKNRTPMLPLLIVACVCLGGLLWLVSRTGNDAQPSVAQSPSPVVAQSVSAEPAVLPSVSQPVPITSQPPVSSAQVPEPAVQPERAEPKSVEPPKVDVKPAEVKQVAPKKVATTAVTNERPSSVAPKPSKSGTMKWKAKPDNYTVQLIAAFNGSSVERIRAQLPAATPSTVHKTTKDGKPWFILVYGSFATKQEAQSAQSRLPDALKKGVKPWVRKQGEVFAQ
ncbi:MAG: SPOR domain-containing protein [Pseudomonadales bacterium]